jgi:hypothetical protein
LSEQPSATIEGDADPAPTNTPALRSPGAGTWCTLAGAVVVLLGVVMPWMRTTVVTQEHVVTGVQGGGPWRAEAWAIVIASVVAAAACGPALLGLHRARADAVELVAGVAILLLVALARAGVHRRIEQLSRLGRAAGLGAVAERGPGLVVVGAGALAVAIGGMVGLAGSAARGGRHRRPA